MTYRAILLSFALTAPAFAQTPASDPATAAPAATASSSTHQWHWNHHRHRRAKQQPQPPQPSSDPTQNTAAFPTPASVQSSSSSPLWTQVTGDNGQTYDVAVLDPPGAANPLILFDDPTTGTVTQYSPISLPSGTVPSVSAPPTNTPSTAAQVPNTKLAQPLVFGPASADNPPPPASDMLTNLQQPPAPSAFPTLTCGLAGAYSVANDEIIGPDGKPFVAKGINIYSAELEKVGAQTVMNTFPGMNFVRVNTYDLVHDTPDALAANVQQLRAHGVMVELEDHNLPQTLAGADLATAVSWYSALASRFKGDPGVVFGTQNEPGGSPAEIENEVNQIYAAVRGTGNNTLVLVNGHGGYTFNGFDPNFLADKHNVVIDHHFYAWEGSDTASLLSKVNDYSAFKSADGPIPVIVGEYGPAAGDGIDQGGSQVVSTVDQSGLGSAAWAWVTWNPGTPGPGDLTVGGNGLSQYGQTIANYLAGPVSPGAATPVSQQAGVCDATQPPPAQPVALTPASTPEPTPPGQIVPQGSMQALNAPTSVPKMTPLSVQGSSTP